MEIFRHPIHARESQDVAAYFFIGGTASVMGLMLFAPPLAELMLKVGPAAEFGLMLPPGTVLNCPGLDWATPGS